jgi:hypothetical protein
LIKSLQLFKSSIKATGGLDELNFSGGRHNLGWYGQTLNNQTESNYMSFVFDFPLAGIQKKTLIELIFFGIDRKSEVGKLNSFKIYTEEMDLILSGSFDFDDEMGPLRVYKSDLAFIQKNLFKDEKNYLEERLQKIYGDKWDENSKNFTVGFEDSGKNSENELLIYLKKSGIECQEGWTANERYVFSKPLIGGIGSLKEDFSSFLLINSNSEAASTTQLFEFIFDSFLKEEVLNKFNSLIQSFSLVNSLSSVRATSERLYFNNSDVVDINQLLLDFSRENFSKSREVTDFIKRSLSLFNIGEEIIVQRHQGVASEIFIKTKTGQKLLADLGFGFTQLVPIIIKIALISIRKFIEEPVEDYFPKSVLILEEPESNLHPSYQSKLAELIIDAANTFDIQFIIETHSEYMIRNFQYLTATKQIPSNGTKIYYFNQPDSKDFKEAPYREIEILNDGRLSNEFGEGFFDEIPRLLAFLYNSSFN